MIKLTRKSFQFLAFGFFALLALHVEQGLACDMTTVATVAAPIKCNYDCVPLAPDLLPTCSVDITTGSCTGGNLACAGCHAAVLNTCTVLPAPSPTPSPTAGCAPAPGDFPTTMTAPMDVYQCLCSGVGISPNFYYPDLTYNTKPCGINPAVCDRWACTATGGSALSCQPGMEP